MLRVKVDLFDCSVGLSRIVKILWLKTYNFLSLTLDL